MLNPMETINRNLGRQPLADLMESKELSNHDLVEASPSPITHKMVARAVKGRMLTPNTQNKILDALNASCKSEYTLHDLFNYGPHMRKERKVSVAETPKADS